METRIHETVPDVCSKTFFDGPCHVALDKQPLCRNEGFLEQPVPRKRALYLIC